MSLTRKAPFELILENFERAVLHWQTAINMRGKMPYWTDERISDSRNDVQWSGQLVRRMSLTPAERDNTIERLRKSARRIEGLLAAHGRGTMNKRWFRTLLKRAADQ